jgi:hypothetical protein
VIDHLQVDLLAVAHLQVAQVLADLHLPADDPMNVARVEVVAMIEQAQRVTSLMVVE